MHTEPTTAAEVWASVRRLKPRPKAPVVHIKPRVIAEPVAIPVKIPAPKVITREALTLTLLRKTVMSVANVSFHDFTSLRRHHSIMKSRFAFYWLAHRYTGASYPQIGRFVGDRNHSTVMSSFSSKTMQLPEVHALITEVERRLSLKRTPVNSIDPPQQTALKEVA